MTVRAALAHGRFSPASRRIPGPRGPCTIGAALHPRACEESPNSPPLIPIYTASPPRLRGIIELSTADSGVHRFTPAPARNHRNRALRRQTPPPHPRARGNSDVPICRFPPAWAISGRVPPLESDSAPSVQAGRISMSPHPKARALPNPCWSRVVNSSTSVNRTIPVRFSMPIDRVLSSRSTQVPAQTALHIDALDSEPGLLALSCEPPRCDRRLGRASFGVGNVTPFVDVPTLLSQGQQRVGDDVGPVACRVDLSRSPYEPVLRRVHPKRESQPVADLQLRRKGLHLKWLEELVVARPALGEHEELRALRCSPEKVALAPPGRKQAPYQSVVQVERHVLIARAEQRGQGAGARPAVQPCPRQVCHRRDDASKYHAPCLQSATALCSAPRSVAAPRGRGCPRETDRCTRVQAVRWASRSVPPIRPAPPVVCVRARATGRWGLPAGSSCARCRVGTRVRAAPVQARQVSTAAYPPTSSPASRYPCGSPGW